jgi:hypothetical protein
LVNSGTSYKLARYGGNPLGNRGFFAAVSDFGIGSLSIRLGSERPNPGFGM